MLNGLRYANNGIVLMLPQRGQGIGVENTEAQYSASGAVNTLLHLLHLNSVVPQIISRGFICCQNSFPFFLLSSLSDFIILCVFCTLSINCGMAKICYTVIIVFYLFLFPLLSISFCKWIKSDIFFIVCFYNFAYVFSNGDVHSCSLCNGKVLILPQCGHGIGQESAIQWYSISIAVNLFLH